MIRENQKLLNRLNVISDAGWIFLSMLLAFWGRFALFPGTISVPLQNYILLVSILIPVYLFTFVAFRMYESFRRIRLYRELGLLLCACTLDMVLLMTLLFLNKEIYFSRGALFLFFLLSFCGLSGKRILLRFLLRRARQKGYNQKHVVVVGDGPAAQRYYQAVLTDRELGYTLSGYVSDRANWFRGPKHLGTYQQLPAVLERIRPDEVVVAISVEDFAHISSIISSCEKFGVRLSLIPLYVEYMPSNPQFDEMDGIPLLNIRRIPLDNLANAFIKRAMDITGSLCLIVLTSPIMLISAIGVRLSSPGPVIFRQKRVGRNKKMFYMYKFRSMRVNRHQEDGWSTDQDSRKTRFGALLRKYSIDELPQFFNVLKGDMSLVGPRPEVPFYVEQFKEEIPLYMVKHQVRPGITGWAQVNGLRGDTSIKARIKHDIYYIEHWDIFFDIKILFLTLFKGIVNQEQVNPIPAPQEPERELVRR